MDQELNYDDQWVGEPVRLYRSKRVCFGRRIGADLAVMAGVGCARLSAESPQHGADTSVLCHPVADICHTVQLHFPCEEDPLGLGCWRRIRRRLGMLARVDPGRTELVMDAVDDRVRLDAAANGARDDLDAGGMDASTDVAAAARAHAVGCGGGVAPMIRSTSSTPSTTSSSHPHDSTGVDIGYDLRWERTNGWSAWDKKRCLGQADNPGPRPDGPGMTYDMATRVRFTVEQAAVVYPHPNGGSLSRVVAPGFRRNAHTAKGVAADEFKLKVETANTTGWAGLKRRLTTTDAHAILAQETWVTQSAIPAAAAWARRRGWRSVWSPAKVTKKGGVSAGVAIFARDYLGLTFPEKGSHELHPSRVVAATMEIPGQRPVTLASFYLRHGGKAAEENASILADLGTAFHMHGDERVCIAGGDANMDPEQVLGTGFDREAEATLFCADSERGTFRTTRGQSTLDYFFVSDRLAPAVSEINLVEASGIKGHVPVQLVLKPRLAALKALYIRPPPEAAHRAGLWARAPTA